MRNIFINSLYFYIFSGISEAIKESFVDIDSLIASDFLVSKNILLLGVNK